MLGARTLAACAASVLILLSAAAAAAAHAAPQDLVIDVNVPHGAVHPEDTVLVTGTVVNQMAEPVPGADVSVKAGSASAYAVTDSEGRFRAAFGSFEGIPGTYLAYIYASHGEMTGIASTEFRLKGELTKVSVLQQQLSTEQARKYLAADWDDFEGDPIGQRLFQHYHGLLEQLILEKREMDKPDPRQAYLEEQRRLAERLEAQKLSKYEYGTATYGGYQYDDYVRSLSPEIRDVVIAQIDFTKSTFENAQIIRAEILASGGTYQEAQKAYLDLVSLPRDVLEQMQREQVKESEQVRPAP